MPMPTLTPLRDSYIAAAGYEGTTLYLEFRNDGAYSYPDVPREIFDAIVAAESPYREFHASVYTKYPGQKIRRWQA